jgi:CDP-glycerol glycerophosphotransferase (TagB/SpsB family)
VSADVNRALKESGKQLVLKGWSRFSRQARIAAHDYPSARRWVCELRAFRWLPEGRFELSGWAYDRDVDYTGTAPTIEVWAQSQRTLPRWIPLEVVPDPSPEVNQPFNGAQKDVDYSRTCFRAVGDLAALADSSSATEQWTFWAGIAAGGQGAKGTFGKAYGLGPAAYLTARRVGDRTATPRWSKAGLGIEIGPLRPTATAVHGHPGGGIEIEVTHPGGLSAAELVTGQRRTALEVSGDGGRVVLRGTVPAAEPGTDVTPKDASGWDLALPPGVDATGAVPCLLSRVLVTDATGRTQPVLLDAGTTDADPLVAQPGPAGELRVVGGECFAVVESAVLTGVDEPVLELSGRCRGDLAGATVRLANERDVRQASLEQDGEVFRARIPLLERRWDQPALPPQIGRLPLWGETREGLNFPLRSATALLDEVPSSVWNRWFRFYPAVNPGLVFAPRLEIPLTDNEIGTFNQARIRRQYESGEWPIVDRMYFESFYGRQCGCNPLALREELVATHPKVPRVWAVRDLSVAVPEGDEAVVDATTAWWRARAESRWLVVNDWLRARFTPREGQTVLQTWHGTMYKKVGLDRGDQLDAEEREFMLGERKKWDLLLSQNPHSTRVFRESYLSNPPIYEEGYPRNDLLVHGDGQPIREVLGIRADQKVVLYAPTWRDDRTELVDYLDVNRLAADLGDGYVVLLRAHSRVIRVGSAAKVGRGVIDVSTYPNTTDLLLIADIMITDYSSIMFDYAVTGRPMIFFTPDMDEYRDQLRGVYLDLEQVGPGPMATTQDEVLAIVRDIDEVAPRFAERYAKWQTDYTPWDDGGSSERVLERLLRDAPPADPAVLG